MTRTAETNEIVKPISGFPITVEFSQGFDMMNVKNPITARFVATGLASVAVSLFGLARLAIPIGAIMIGIEPAFPIGVCVAAHRF